MAHYAFINSEDIGVDVIVGVDEDDTDNLPSDFSSWEEFYESQRTDLTCKRTSFNTRNGIYTTTDKDGDIIAGADGEQGKAFRGNFAMIGGTYDSSKDVFLPPKVFDSWVYDADNVSWKAPVDRPDDYEVVPYLWNEKDQEWTEVTADNDPNGDHFG